MLNVLPFVIKYWRYIAIASLVAGAMAYGSYMLWKAKQEGRQECVNEVIIKELTHVVEVKTKQNAAAANRPASRTAVIERLQSGIF